MQETQSHLWQVNNYSSKDSSDFASAISDMHFINELIDIKSLFIHLPLIETTDYLFDISTAQENDTILQRAVKQSPLRGTLNTQFLFDGTFYNQRDAVAMDHLKNWY